MTIHYITLDRYCIIGILTQSQPVQTRAGVGLEPGQSLERKGPRFLGGITRAAARKKRTMKYKQNLRIEGTKVISYSTHVATIDSANRQLLVHGWWSKTTSKHVNHVADEFSLTKVDSPQDTDTDTDTEAENEVVDSMLKSTALVASLASLFATTQKESNDWKARMLKAGLGNRGLTMPENWNELDEATKTKRLDSVIAIANEGVTNA